MRRLLKFIRTTIRKARKYDELQGVLVEIEAVHDEIPSNFGFGYYADYVGYQRLRERRAELMREMVEDAA